jgi:hypothetical protein
VLKFECLKQMYKNRKLSSVSIFAGILLICVFGIMSVCAKMSMTAVVIQPQSDDRPSYVDNRLLEQIAKEPC